MKKSINSKPCPDCLPPSACLTCDELVFISSDSTVKATKQTLNTNGKCIWNLRVVGGGAFTLNKLDSPTIQWEGNGSTLPLKAHVKLSADAGNLIGFGTDGGLIVAPGAIAETPNSKVDSPSVNITLSGTANRIIRADFRVSPDAGNVMEIRANGIYVSPSSTDVMEFKPGDANYPAIGASTFIPVGNNFLNKKVVVFRNFILQPLKNLGDGNTYVTKPINSNTLTFSAALTADDYIIILVL
jgi:hypothetical protein